MNLEIYWQIIELAWEANQELKTRRNELTTLEGIKRPGKLGKQIEKCMNDEIYPVFETRLAELPMDDLLQFTELHRVNLFTIDRFDIGKYLGGSDDGFLYSRGFVIGLGKESYCRINDNPRLGTLGLESEGFAYMPFTIFSMKYDVRIMSKDPDYETGSNRLGWLNEPEDDTDYPSLVGP